MDIPIDAIHEPGFMFDYALTWMSVSAILCTCAYFAALQAAIKRRTRHVPSPNGATGSDAPTGT